MFHFKKRWEWLKFKKRAKRRCVLERAFEWCICLIPLKIGWTVPLKKACWNQFESIPIVKISTPCAVGPDKSGWKVHSMLRKQSCTILFFPCPQIKIEQKDTAVS